MDDIEERPSKIRKLNTTEPANELMDTLEASISVAPDITNEKSPPEDAAPVIPTTTENPLPLSKSALKKIRRKEAWAAGAEDRRLKRREKHKVKQARKAIAREELESKIAAGEVEAPPKTPKPPPRPLQVPVSLLLDCGFDELMTEKELISLGSQLTRCYSENRSARFRTHLCVSEWGGRLKERFETVLRRDHESWKGVTFEEGDFVKAGKAVDAIMRGKQGGRPRGALEGVEGVVEQYNGVKVQEEEEEKKEIPVGGESSLKEEPQEPAMKEGEEGKNAEPKTSEHHSNGTTTQPAQPTEPQMVYLSSDSPHTLTHLSPYTTYIIGGIVDKNRHKGICYKRAEELGIPTAKLPIGEYMVMQSRTVLAINHVVEIMLRWLEVGDWGVAFERVIPKRKGGVLRSKGSNDGVENGDRDGEGREGDDHDYEDGSEHLELEEKTDGEVVEEDVKLDNTVEKAEE